MSDARFRLRATRASPPGRAADDDRPATYGASLAQFDELMAAAAVATPASRPLPLFYALSQAGRAIAAALRTDPWRLRMHGLSAPELDVEVLRIRVERRRDTSKDGDAIDSFTGVATATNADAFTDVVELGDVWWSLPEVMPEFEG